MWTYTRIDRIEGKEVHCVFCNRPLRSGRVLVVKDSEGVEAYAGPTCAKKHVGSPTEQLLDLSKMAMLLVAKSPDQKSTPASAPAEPDCGEVQSAKQVSPPRTQLDADDVVNYLRLRAEHMPDFTGHATARLREFHSQIDSEPGLSADARLYTERLMSKAKAANSIYALHNIEKCIGAAFWLRLAIEHTKPDRREFLETMLRSLHENWKLSFGQIQAVNKWGDGVRKQVRDFPVLDTSAFSGVQAPRFSAT